MTDTNNTDITSLQCYLVGFYVYSVYKDKTGGIDISGSDTDIFYLTLGFHIDQSYPKVYNKIISLFV